MEANLVLAWARPGLPDDGVAGVRAAVEAAPDWERLLEFARHQGLLPVVAQNLVSAARDLLPAPVARALRTESVGAATAGLRMAAGLLEVVGALEARGIPVLTYKGPALAASVYGSVALRTSCDLDLWVAPEDVWRAAEAMRELGYGGSRDFTPRQRQSLVRHACELVLHRSGGPMVEVHWQLLSRLVPRPFLWDELWNERRTVEVAPGEVATMSPDHNLILLCVHGAKHQWYNLRLVLDVALLMEREGELDLERTLALAADRKLLRMVLLGVALTRDLFGVKVPAAVERRIERDPGVAFLVEDVRRRLLSAERAAGGLLGEAQFHLRAQDDWRGRLRYQFQFAIPPTEHDWQWVRLPDALFPLYYLTRPLRLATRYARAGRLRGRRE